MGYKKLFLRDGLLLIEKYYGVVDFDDIINADEEIYTDDFPSDETFLVLADLSEARFPNITYEQIVDLFKVIDQFAATTNGMKHAFYTGNMEMEDFNKAHKYIEVASSKALSMVPFSHLDLAYDWLGLSKDEKNAIDQFLSKK